MIKKRGGRVSNYGDAFKRQLVAESFEATVPVVAKRHGVSTNRIYSWRQDERFQPDVVDPPGFLAVDVSGPVVSVAQNVGGSNVPRIEITLENGRKLSISGGVDAGFVLELARGLSA